MAAVIAVSLAASLLGGRISGAQTIQKTAQEKAQAPAQTTIKTQVRQVLLDVVVTDGKNRPMTGLKRKDFSVTEDGTPQTILSFEARTTVNQAADGADPPLELPKLPENTFLNFSRAREDLPLNVILYDLLNTPISDQPFARRELRKFLRNKPPGSRYAIFVLSDKLHLLQGVTDSEAELLAAMDSRAAGSQSPALGVPPTDAVSAGTALADSGLVPEHPEAQALLDRLSHLESVGENYFLQRRVELTLTAFGDISQFLRGVPGRKNLLWLSGSFPLGVLPGGDPIDPFSRAVDFSPGLRQATNQLTLNQVAVYPVDIRGLTISSIYDAASNRRYSQDSLDGDRRKFWSQLTAEHDAMDEIAEFSGGHAFYNTNGFEQALHAATEDGANYYTLSYSPSNTRFDGGIRKIHIKVVRQGLRLSYRRNYFADDDFTLAQRAARAPLERTSATMERGAPTDHELVFSVHAKAIGLPAAVTPAQIADLSQFAPFARFKKWDSVKMQRYELDFSLLLKQITYLITPDGVRHGSLDFIYAAYDADSNLLYSSASTGDQTILPQESDHARTGFFLAEQILDIPANTAWLRIGVRDAVDARIGSLEIPLPLRPE
jgi:VWFA-related protein